MQSSMVIRRSGMKKRWLGLCCAVVIGVSLGGVAAAQGKVSDHAKQASGPATKKDDKKTAETEKRPAVKVERTAEGRKVYRITTGFVIEGRIQKPNAFYVLQRSQINYDWARLNRDFLPGILEAVKKDPF